MTSSALEQPVVVVFSGYTKFIWFDFNSSSESEGAVNAAGEGNISIHVEADDDEEIHQQRADEMAVAYRNTSWYNRYTFFIILSLYI